MIGRHLFVRRLFSVGTPMPFVSAGIRVEYDDTVIEISIGYVDFVCFQIDFRICWTAKTSNVIGVCLLSRLADCHQKFPSSLELQILAITITVAANPNESRCIDSDAVLVLRPVIALA